jgi:hypothetical protein
MSTQIVDTNTTVNSTANVANVEKEKEKKEARPRFFTGYDLVTKTTSGRLSGKPDLAAKKKSSQIRISNSENPEIVNAKTLRVCIKETTKDRPKIYYLYDVTRIEIENPKETLLKIKDENDVVIGTKPVTYKYKNNAINVDKYLPQELIDFNTKEYANHGMDANGKVLKVQNPQAPVKNARSKKQTQVAQNQVTQTQVVDSNATANTQTVQPVVDSTVQTPVASANTSTPKKAASAKGKKGVNASANVSTNISAQPTPVSA